LALRNGLDVRHASFHADMDKLIRGLGGQRATPSGAIVVDVSLNGRSKTRAFVPGNGRTEWFTDHPQGPEMVVVPSGSAARAGTTTPFWCGASITTAEANYEGNYTCGSGGEGEWRRSTVPVGSFAANPWGLFNVHGSVWEWCADGWHDNYNGAPTDGSAWLQGGEASRRVVRGGSWNDDPQYLRSAYRGWNTTGVRLSNLGFRVPRTLHL
jgi:Sulfatase-modifying factor enzyme 1